MDSSVLRKKIQDNDYEGVKNQVVEIKDNTELIQCLFLSLTLERREIFDYILGQLHCELHDRNENGETLLHRSLKCSDEYFLVKLLKRGLNLDLDIYKSILHNAVVTDKPNMVEPFLKYGAVTNIGNVLDITPLDIAIENNNFEIVSMFLYYDCGTTSRTGHISPFMYSMLCNSTPEIQLLLLDYEADMNYTFLSRNNLFIAIKRCKYLIRDILDRGADVNQICNNRNVIEFILDHPIDTDIFAIIWEKFDYTLWQSVKRWSIIMDILTESSLPDNLWFDYLRIVIESPKLMQILDTQSTRLISIFIDECVKRKFEESDYYELICILLTNSCPVYPTDLHKVYNLLGSKSLVLKLLIHINLESSNLKFLDINFIKVRYCCNNTIDQMLRNFFINMRIFDMKASYKDILRYFAVPPLARDYLRNPVPSTLQFLTWTPVVPTLVELARNRSRDAICEKLKVKNGGMYYSIVNHSVLPKVIKDLLTFQKPLYYEA